MFLHISRINSIALNLLQNINRHVRNLLHMANRINENKNNHNLRIETNIIIKMEWRTVRALTVSRLDCNYSDMYFLEFFIIFIMFIFRNKINSQKSERLKWTEKNITHGNIWYWHITHKNQLLTTTKLWTAKTWLLKLVHTAFGLVDFCHCKFMPNKHIYIPELAKCFYSLSRSQIRSFALLCTFSYILIVLLVYGFFISILIYMNLNFSSLV